ncbi:hemerythrin domain-containing protein [Micromonospora musae]|uniref:hemerythrin domain-containing protein n=1 Tax=Micromonospora musae TaxID=1894970 RepID=UPI0033EAB4C6
MHRQATALLAEAAPRPGADIAHLTELRDFLVAQLGHHHESEDHDLWPMIEAAAPGISEPLQALSDEHDALDAALSTGGRRLGPSCADSPERTRRSRAGQQSPCERGVGKSRRTSILLPGAGSPSRVASDWARGGRRAPGSIERSAYVFNQ